MMRSARWIAVLAVIGALGTACATYRDDLDRAMGHYNRNQYENALALLQVLELDTDSLSVRERAQYAYYRGMSHFRLGQKRDARHWLGVAAATEKKENGSLGPDEKKRVDETLDELNRSVYGIVESGSSTMGKKCKADSDCAQGQFCDSGSCAGMPGQEGEEPGPADGADAEPAEPSEPAPAPAEAESTEPPADG